MSDSEIPKKLTKTIQDLLNKSSSFGGISYSLNEGISSVFSSCEKDDLISFISNPGAISTVLYNCGISKYYAQMTNRVIVSRALELLGSKVDDLAKKNKNPYMTTRILELGLYSDLSVVDEIFLNSSGEVRLAAAKIASIDALRKMVGKGDKQLRLIVYQRLGPAECLDAMIDDPFCNIRELGYSMAPFGYEKLNEKTGEIARGPTLVLARKISLEYLPMLLANKNLKKSPEVRRIIEARMSAGE